MTEEYVCNDDYCELVKKDTDLDMCIDIPKDMPKPCNKIEWLVYGASWCPFCMKAKELLESKNVNFVYVEIEDYTQPDAFKQMMADITSDYKTIPMIFNREKFIGGYSDLCNSY